MREPGQVSFNLTAAMRRALIATNDQKVFRIYDKSGNHFHVLKTGAGISARILWQAIKYRLIEDEPGTETGGIQIRCRMRLTKAGLAVLPRTGRAG